MCACDFKYTKSSLLYGLSRPKHNVIFYTVFNKFDKYKMLGIYEMLTKSIPYTALNNKVYWYCIWSKLKILSIVFWET